MQTQERSLVTWLNPIARMFRYYRSNGIVEGFHRKTGQKTLKRKKGLQLKSYNPLIFFGTPDRIRTCDPLIRSQVLYPAELLVHRR